MKINDFNEAGSNRDAYQRDYDSSVSGMGRPDDHRGLRQELAHETNNIAVYINGKLWKVWAGKGTADSREERAYLNNMQGWAANKSAATGKKWTVGLTGANVSEATSAAVRMQRAADKQRAKSDASLARTPSSIPKKEEPKQQGVAEGWKDESDDYKEWSNHVKDALLSVGPSQQYGMAQRLSQIERTHFGSDIQTGFNAQTGKPDSTSSKDLTGTVSQIYRAIKDGSLASAAPAAGTQQTPFGSVNRPVGAVDPYHASPALPNGDRPAAQAVQAQRPSGSGNIKILRTEEDWEEALNNQDSSDDSPTTAAGVGAAMAKLPSWKVMLATIMLASKLPIIGDKIKNSIISSIKNEFGVQMSFKEALGYMQHVRTTPPEEIVSPAVWKFEKDGGDYETAIEQLPDEEVNVSPAHVMATISNDLISSGIAQEIEPESNGAGAFDSMASQLTKKTESIVESDYTPAVGDEVLWRHSDPQSKMMPMPGTVLALAPGKVKLRIYSKRMIQDSGKDTLVLDLNHYTIMPKQGVAEMDSQGYTGSRDHKSKSTYGSRDDYELGHKKEYTAKAITPGQTTKKATDILNKAFNNADKKKGVAEAGLKFNGGFPDVDHMNGPRGINLPLAPTKKFFTDKQKWSQTVDDINSSKYDDNSEYTGMTGRSTVSIDGREWARWSDAQQKGYIELSSMSEQGVAEGEGDEEQGYMLGTVLSFPDFIKQLSLTLRTSNLNWKMTKRDDNVFLFSAPNDHNIHNMLVIAVIHNGWVSATNGVVYPGGEVSMGDKQELPMTVASVSEIAQEAIHSYHSLDLSDYADEGELDESDSVKTNPKDKICVDVPLFIRLMEYAREDAKSDMDLHSLAERLTAMSASGETLGMDSYDAVVGSETPVEEASLAQMRDYFSQPDNNTVDIDNQYGAPERKPHAHVPPEIQSLINKMYRVGKITPQEFNILKNFQLKTKINVGLNIKEADKNPYAIGMAAAMKSTGDKPPLKKSTINKAHEIARAVKKGD